jgi:hypothetical protein
MTPEDSALVSVIIPTFNYAHFVVDAVESALAQTYRPVEVIVVDDGSTDDTRARLEPYRDRITYIHQPNQGLSAARNTAIRSARGPVVALLDADDQFHPRKLELQMAYLAAHPAVGLVACESFEEPARRWPVIDPVGVPATPVGLRALAARSRFAPSSVAVRRACLDAVGPFDPGLRSAEDRDMWIRVAFRFPMARLEAPLCWYRVQPGSMSHNPDRMERYEQVVLDRAFALPPLRGARLLRRKALSEAAAAAAYMHLVAGRPWAAARRLARSVGLWPLPYPRADTRTPLARLKLSARLAGRALRPFSGSHP